MTKILVTGGSGYIGSHTVVALIEQGLSPVIFDNFCNSHRSVVDRVESITGVRPVVVEGDVCDAVSLDYVFSEYDFGSVIHFAGLKAIGESVAEPLLYYQSNVGGALQLFDIMAKHDCRRLVFSSSAAVYGDPLSVPIKEHSPLQTTNPYGQSKLMIESILRDLSHADPRWQISLLRYFNPIAAHPSALIGEHASGIPNNLLPYIAQVSVGSLDRLSVYGDDYDTPDGTGVRDYIHVCDLADAHVKALNALNSEHGCDAYNIGTGDGYSVLEIIAAFEKASGVSIPYAIEPRRPGDIASSYADPSYSADVLDWKAQYGLAQMMEDLWRWQSENPNGYD